MAISKTASCFQLGVRFPDGSVQSTAAGGTYLPLAGGTLSGTLNVPTGDLVITGATYNVTIASAASASYTLTFPTTAGTNTYLLQTDGSGNLSWVAPPSAPTVNLAQTQRRIMYASPAGGSTGTGITSNCIGDTLTNVGGSPFNSTTVPTSAHGPTSDWSNASGDTAFGFNGENMWLAGKNLSFECGTVLYRTTDIRIWMGFFNASTLTVSDTIPSSNYAAFRYSTIAGDQHWMCVARDGTTQATPVDTGVSPGTSQKSFGIKCDDANSQYLFYIDGVLKGTVSSNLITANTVMRPCIQANWHTGTLAPLYGTAYVAAQADW